jgi:hypothetical protein
MGRSTQILTRSVQYFAFVFGAGSILGPIRVMWVVPRLGNRIAELAEMPFMLAVMIFASRWILRRWSPPPAWDDRMAMGCIALALMLVAEFSLVLSLRGISISDYIATRDPVSGWVYLVMLGVYAFLPLLSGAKMPGRCAR